MKGDTLLDLAGVAARLELAYSTVRGYHNLAARRRVRDESRPGDMPPPDARFGSAPVWRADSIDRWITTRPGRGAGGGRPRKEHDS